MAGGRCASAWRDVHRQRFSSAMRTIASDSHLPEVAAYVEGLCLRVLLLEGLERRQVEVELVDVVL